VALQKEYICTTIRKFIYSQTSDKKHFDNVLFKKKNKILSIGRKNKLNNIFNDKSILSEFYYEIVPEYGLPRFIYNERTQPDQIKKQYNFPYSGTLVEVKSKGSKKIGVTDYVDFNNKAIYVRFLIGEKSERIYYKKVRRLSVEECDRYYYYKDGYYKYRNKEGYIIGIDYDFFNNIIKLKYEKEIIETNGDNVSRYLNDVIKWIYMNGSKKNG
jgi:hypothetical protein